RRWSGDRSRPGRRGNNSRGDQEGQDRVPVCGERRDDVLTDKSVRDLLAAFASSDPTPGGGSASAVASAMGASLLLMVAALPKTRHGTDEDRAALAGAAAALVGVQQQLVEAIDADSVAYDAVV